MKSFFIAFGVTAGVLFLVMVATLVAGLAQPMPPGVEAVGWSPVAFLRGAPLWMWIALLVIFCATFAAHAHYAR